MLRAWSVMAVIFVVIGTVLFGVSVSASSSGGFENRFLVVSSRSTAGIGGTVLENAQLRDLGGQAFLVGRSADDGQAGNWLKGQRVWMPVSDVYQIVEFPDLEQYKRTFPQRRR